MGTRPTLAYSAPRFRAEPYLSVAPSTIPWLVKSVLPATGVAFLVGATKAGKSFLGLDMSLRISSGMKVMDKRTRRTGVAYIGAEDAEGCRTRIVAWRQTYKAADLPFDFYGQRVNLLNHDDLAQLAESLAISHQRFESLGQRLGLIVVDTFSRCIPGADENGSEAMSQAFDNLAKLGHQMGALILVVAHFGKAGEDRGIRGWSGLDANSDATISLERDEDDPDLRTLTISKVKNARDGAKLSFRLESVELDMIDDDGDTLSSCICAYEASPDRANPRRRKKAMTAIEQLVLVGIRDVVDGGRTQPPPPFLAGVKPWTRAIDRKDLAKHLMNGAFRLDGEKMDAARMRLGRALHGLAAQQRIGVNGDLIWLVEFGGKSEQVAAAV
jgi:hypothetical protein